MRERPILFSAPMVRAILSGAKTQTRRAIRADLDDEEHLHVGMYHPTVTDRHGNEQPGAEVFGAWTTDGEWAMPCPYGQPGDRLWGRENGWQRPERTAKMMREGADTWSPYYFDADGISDAEAADFKAWGFKRRPSIHLPRAHCRIQLEVTGIRIQRLQDISPSDAAAEGAMAWAGEQDSPIRDLPGEDARVAFSALWESVGGSWQANPWVWVVEFRRATA